MRTADGSALISIGKTRVICTASLVEYSTLAGGPRARLADGGVRHVSGVHRRTAPARRLRGRADGRTVEIQRLIGRSLRAVVDFEALEAHTVYLDCDVLEADGGTRCAGITGAYVALQLALAVGRSRQARADAADELGCRGLVRARRRRAGA